MELTVASGSSLKLVNLIDGTSQPKTSISETDSLFVLGSTGSAGYFTKFSCPRANIITPTSGIANSLDLSFDSPTKLGLESNIGLLKQEKSAGSDEPFPPK